MDDHSSMQRLLWKSSLPKHRYALEDYLKDYNACLRKRRMISPVPQHIPHKPHLLRFQGEGSHYRFLSLGLVYLDMSMGEMKRQ